MTVGWDVGDSASHAALAVVHFGNRTTDRRNSCCHHCFLAPQSPPPFPCLLYAVLTHYQIRVLHLNPGSIILLSGFAFLCEAFIGVSPSVALLRHFFAL